MSAMVTDVFFGTWYFVRFMGWFLGVINGFADGLVTGWFLTDD